jgi:transposase
MRYELADHEWAAIKPMLPNKPRGVPRVNDRRVLNGIFWVLRSGAPWRDLPNAFGPYTTCYNRFVRWRRAGVWSRLMNALAGAHDAAVQMIDTSIVRVHQHGACITRNRRQSMGRSRGGLTSKIHALGQRATTSLRPTTLPSSSSRQYGSGCALMRPRPSGQGHPSLRTPHFDLAPHSLPITSNLFRLIFRRASAVPAPKANVVTNGRPFIARCEQNITFGLQLTFR